MKEGDNQGENLVNANSNLASVIANSIDIDKLKEFLEKYKEYKENGPKLRKDINNEIIKLENKFDELKNANKPKFY